jgi:predicted acetyltransferase
VFRELQQGDGLALDDAQRIMALEDFVFAFDYVPGQDLAAYLKQLEDNRAARNLAPGKVASTFEVAVLDGRIAARLSVRHELNEFLLQQGGHIGYGVLPEFRSQGLGTACLQRGLEITSTLGITRALVTCDEDNHISRRIIEHAGGHYESSHPAPTPIRRYWLPTPPAS